MFLFEQICFYYNKFTTSCTNNLFAIRNYFQLDHFYPIIMLLLLPTRLSLLCLLQVPSIHYSPHCTTNPTNSLVFTPKLLSHPHVTSS